MAHEGILLIDKPEGITSFSLVSLLRKVTGVSKIGHAGTLDPFATGVMVLLIGKKYTRLSSSFLTETKEYEATIRLGFSTNTYDKTGDIDQQSDQIPSLDELTASLASFQGLYMQHPPMFSAKKVQGKKLYELARQGKTIERKLEPVTLSTTLLTYEYPYICLHIRCSKGTYIRSIAHDLGERLGCYGHVSELRRVRSGNFSLANCISIKEVQEGNFPLITDEKPFATIGIE